ncbi:MAG: nitroreductase family deazaflavin-dependent oxidoreductase [Xanthomonadales bacterium]|nr:nitroreductase family deazaflavin-dependent oxidoreductase [Xanthomonadales bacterium]NIN58668.1 nitroreductase family deazaflavin-dependent oxidoreductase [Xanthomonadales bacterium]NIN74518.1 nitroreductase family deazaflavin-dependent oxidoreductase [Xanthomonadales bacterium]NIO14823.1 nitroreductase family deazaflavin-dependent oxidoreductase [Xanthomonadales bacterium]NIP11061.1 nitroreductase family deazaflavin-dependent oxidoreductase [Xanthomonadales bacterium]
MSEPQTTRLPSWIADHIRLYLEDPERGHRWDSTAAGGPGVLPALLLKTTGRKSGRTQLSPLIYGTDDGRYVIVASKGGAPTHPAWYLNLVSQPDCEIQVGPDHHRVHARTSDGEERERLWRMMAEIYPPYDDYQDAASQRRIPVVVLEPRD